MTDLPVTKVCRVCGQSKDLTEFYKTPGGRDGRRTECIDCNREQKRLRNAANPEANRQRALAWQRENRERYLEYQQRYGGTIAKKISDRKSHLKRKYGLTPTEYDEMLAEQGGGCAICGATAREDSALHVDHDHDTGAVRGILCFPCNSALGRFYEDPDLLLGAMDYLAASDGDADGGAVGADDPDVDELTALARARAHALVGAP